MPLKLWRLGAVAAALTWLLFATLNALADAPTGAGDTIPPVAPVLVNNNFECATGFYSMTNPAGERIRVPTGWDLVFISGAPETNSARREVTRNCDTSTDQHIEKIEGLDSWIVKAQDLESTSEPGKPFDVSFVQSLTATVGGYYSLSGWMVSLCGGSFSAPNDCPEGYYMAKLLGFDPTGGRDPQAESVIWVENRQNFIEDGQRVGWTNLYFNVQAQAPTVTVFARINSPFQWHGNHAFVDAISLIRAPAAALAVPSEITGTAAIIIWDAAQSPDVERINQAESGNYQLYVDVQYRYVDALEWTNWITGALGAGSQVFTAKCQAATYEFRVRARAEQPEGEPGSFPTQRYLGVWSAPATIYFNPVDNPPPDDGAVGDVQAYLPLVLAYRDC